MPLSIVLFRLRHNIGYFLRVRFATILLGAHRMAQAGSGILRARWGWIAVYLPLILILSAWIGSSRQIDFLVKALIALTIYFTFVSLVFALFNSRSALRTGIATTAVIAALNVLRPAGHYDEMATRPLILNAESAIIRVVFPLFPDSDRWKRLDPTRITPYVFISSPSVDSNNRISIRMDGYETEVAANVPGVVVAPRSAIAAPIPWSVLRDRRELEVTVTFRADKTMYLPTVPSIPLLGRSPQQDIFRNGKWQRFDALMKEKTRATIELRFADSEMRNHGILY